MPVSTSLATQRQWSESKMFDLETYVICKEYLGNKDRRIAEHCIQLIESVSRESSSSSLRILDIGSGEGSLLRRILEGLDVSGLAGRGIEVEVDCVESDEGAQYYLDGLAAFAQEKGVRVALNYQPIESFLDETTKHYDIVLSIHSLYHINTSQWEILLRHISRRINKHGALLVDLVSRRSSIYQIYEDVLYRIDKLGLPRTYDIDGWLYFSEDLNQLFFSVFPDAQVHHIESRIVFPQNVLFKCRQALWERNMSKCDLSVFLAFMFRVTPSDLLVAAKDELTQVIASDNGEINFDSEEDLFIWRCTT